MKQRLLGTIFKQMREVIQDHVCFAPLCIVTGPQKIQHKPITTWPPVFSRASSSLCVVSLNSHWLLITFPSVLIGYWEHFGIDFPDLFWLAVVVTLVLVLIKTQGSDLAHRISPFLYSCFLCGLKEAKQRVVSSSFLEVFHILLCSNLSLSLMFSLAILSWKETDGTKCLV